MIIDRIDAFPLTVPFGAGRGRSRRRPGRRRVTSLLVRVTTDEGHQGWGEAFGFEGAAVTRRALEDLVAPLCAGQDATRTGPLMRQAQQKLHVFGRGGAVIHALSAVDTALWDIAGKAAGVPLHRLLGGSGRADLPCYASLDPYGSPAAVRAGVAQALGAGFTDVKLHERDPAAVRAAREEAGPRTGLMLDVNCPWTLAQAAEMAARFRDQRAALAGGAAVAAGELRRPRPAPGRAAASRSPRGRTSRRCSTSTGCWPPGRWTTSSRAPPRWAASPNWPRSSTSPPPATSPSCRTPSTTAPACSRRSTRPPRSARRTR